MDDAWSFAYEFALLFSVRWLIEMLLARLVSVTGNFSLI